MKLIHLADLHLGFRQFSKMTPAGRNQREADVTATFSAAVDRIVELRPDLIVVAGDIFHTPRPSPLVIHEALREFSRLTKTARTVVIAGNHDGPKVSEGAGHILAALSFVGCDVVWKGVLDRDGVVCVPEHETHDLTWRQTTGNILLLHGEVAGTLPFESPHAIPKAAFHPEGWQYIALGHYHVRSDLWPNGGYAGSLDYVSSDIWGEARSGVPKGFLEFDTETQRRTFHPSVPRQVVDLPVLETEGWSATKLTEAIVTATEFSGLPEGAIVRQVVKQIEKTEWRAADHKAIKDAGKRFLAFQVSPVFAKSAYQKTTVAQRQQTLQERFEEHLKKRHLPPDVPLDKILALGLDYLQQAASTTTGDHQ